MSFAIDERTPRTQILLMTAVIVASLVLPVAAVWQLCIQATTDSLFLSDSAESRWFKLGGVKNGELWFPVTGFSDNIVRIKRLNLETGVERESLLTPSEGSKLSLGYVLWIDDTLYFYTPKNMRFGSLLGTEVRQAVGSALVRIDNADLQTGAFLGQPFEYEGHFSLIQFVEPGNYRLLCWNEGKWVDHGRILLPSIASAWIDDPQSDEKVLTVYYEVPIQQDDSSLQLDVVRHNQETLLFVQFRGSDFFAMRNGFEFADQDSYTASALTPENAAPIVSGWTPVLSVAKDYTRANFKYSRDDLFTFWYVNFLQFRVPVAGNSVYARYNKDGLFEQLVEQEDDVSLQMPDAVVTCAAGHCESTSYIFTSNFWNELSIRRIEGKLILPSHVVKKGLQQEYVGRWSGFVGKIVAGWLLHVAILVIGIDRLSHCRRGSLYRFAGQSATIASARRRILASAVDLLLLTTICLCCGFIYWWIFTGDRMSTTNYLAYFILEDLEFSFFARLRGATTIKEVADIFFDRIEAIASWVQWNSFLVNLIVTCATLTYVLKVCLENRYRMTPGKWLLGIRTVSETLRQPDLAQTISRDVSICFDFPLLITPLPAAVSMILSSSGQRCGDRAAGTIVIDADSVSNF